MKLFGYVVDFLDDSEDEEVVFYWDLDEGLVVMSFGEKKKM